MPASHYNIISNCIDRYDDTISMLQLHCTTPTLGRKVMAVSLESLLALIPEENRHLLDHKMDDRPKLATIANSIQDWPTVAQYLPGIRPNDIEAIKYDNLLSLNQQK